MKTSSNLCVPEAFKHAMSVNLSFFRLASANKCYCWYSLPTQGHLICVVDLIRCQIFSRNHLNKIANKWLNCRFIRTTLLTNAFKLRIPCPCLNFSIKPWLSSLGSLVSICASNFSWRIHAFSCKSIADIGFPNDRWLSKNALSAFSSLGYALLFSVFLHSKWGFDEKKYIKALTLVMGLLQVVGTVKTLQF